MVDVLWEVFCLEAGKLDSYIRDYVQRKELKQELLDDFDKTSEDLEVSLKSLEKLERFNDRKERFFRDDYPPMVQNFAKMIDSHPDPNIEPKEAEEVSIKFKVYMLGISKIGKMLSKLAESDGVDAQFAFQEKMMEPRMNLLYTLAMVWVPDEEEFGWFLKQYPILDAQISRRHYGTPRSMRDSNSLGEGEAAAPARKEDDDACSSTTK